MSSSHPPEVDEDLITIQMDDRRFSSNKSLLRLSSFYFADLFDPIKYRQPEDGIYRINGRSDLFHYILHYCETKAFPFFFSEDKGFDHTIYIALLAESIRFGIKQLSDWIKEGKYLDTVETKVITERCMTNLIDPTPRIGPVTQNAFTTPKVISDVQYYDTYDERYMCPRGIYSHCGDSSWKCGRQCQNATPESGPIYEKVPRIGIMITTKKVIIKHELLMPALLLLSEEQWNNLSDS